MRVTIIISCVILCCLVCPSLSDLISEDDYDYVLIKLLRPKRQFFDTTVKGTVGGRRTLFEYNGRKLEGYGQFSRTWDPRQATVFAGGFDGTSDRGTYKLSSGFQRDKGITAGTNGRYNLYKNENTQVDAYAGYDRTLGPGSSSNRGWGLDIQRTV